MRKIPIYAIFKEALYYEKTESTKECINMGKTFNIRKMFRLFVILTITFSLVFADISRVLVVIANETGSVAQADYDGDNYLVIEDDYYYEYPDLIEDVYEEDTYDYQYEYEVIAEEGEEYVPIVAQDANYVTSGNVGGGPNWETGAPWSLYDDGTIVVGGWWDNRTNWVFGGWRDPWGFEWADIPPGLNVYRIVFTEPVVGGPDLSNLFGTGIQMVDRPEFQTLRYIENLHYLDTSNTTNMGRMFQCATQLTAIDVGHFDTSNVTNMTYMFGCGVGVGAGWYMRFTDLDVSNWDVSRVTNMFSMFEGATQLTYLDVSNWDTRSATTMQQMFMYTRSLEEIDVSHFNLSNVTNIASMFADARSLETIDVSNWDVSRVTGMNQFLHHAASISEIDMSNWDTSSAVNMHNMFSHTRALRTIDINNWDTSRVTNMAMMFEFSVFEELDLSNWDTSSVTSMAHMFNLARDLERLDLAGFDTSSVLPNGLHNMFNDATSLRELTLGEGWQTVGNPALPNVPTTAVYTGRWQNVASGTVAAPAGTHSLTSTVLMNTAGGRPPVPDTWVWERWERIPEETVTVTFNLHGGTGDFSPQNVEIGGLATEPATNPVKTGYSFLGWFTTPAEVDVEEDEDGIVEPIMLNDGVVFDFTVPITEDTVIHARWEVSEPNDNGGNNGGDNNGGNDDENGDNGSGTPPPPPGSTPPTGTPPGITPPIPGTPENETDVEGENFDPVFPEVGPNGIQPQLPQTNFGATTFLPGGIILLAAGFTLASKKDV